MSPPVCIEERAQWPRSRALDEQYAPDRVLALTASAARTLTPAVSRRPRRRLLTPT